MRSAIVLDGGIKSALSVVRSLGEKGIPVSVGCEREIGMALHSKYLTSKFLYPSPYTDKGGFIEVVKAEAIRLGDRPVVYMFSDSTYLALYEYRNELDIYMTFIFPEEKSIEIAFDKSATYSLARVSGVPTITTYTPEYEEEVVRLAPACSFPLVLKSRKSVTWNNGVGTFGTAVFIHDAETLVKTFSVVKNKIGEAPIIQEMLYGEEYGVEMLAHKGKSCGVVTHHRMRSLSPTGGASVLKEILNEGDLRNSLETYTKVLVSKLKWSGPIMVEFKVDSSSFLPYLMEINGRFWGSLPLSVASGVDIPYLYYQYAESGKLPQSISSPREGTTTRHSLGDVRHLGRVLFSRDKMRRYLYPTRSIALRNFFSIPKGAVSDVWSWKDPKPALFEIIDVIQKTFSRK